MRRFAMSRIEQKKPERGSHIRLFLRSMAEVPSIIGWFLRYNILAIEKAAWSVETISIRRLFLRTPAVRLPAPPAQKPKGEG